MRIWEKIGGSTEISLLCFKKKASRSLPPQGDKKGNPKEMFDVAVCLAAFSIPFFFEVY